MVIYNMPKTISGTDYLISESRETGYPIVVATYAHKHFLIEKLERLDIKGIQVFAVDEILRWGLRGYKIDGLLVEDLDCVLNELLGAPVKIATITMGEKD